MSRRSQSPEGVGDLLKHDSFNTFEEEDPMQDAPHDPDTAMGGDAGGDDLMAVEASKDGLSTSEGGRETQHNGATCGGTAYGVRPGFKRIPVPKFGKATTTGSSGATPTPPPGSKGPARYFIVKSNNHSNIEHSIKNGIWATQVCH